MNKLTAVTPYQKNVLNTIIEWPGLESKIIILVGHGLLNLIQCKSNVHKIKIITKNYTTFIN